MATHPHRSRHPHEEKEKRKLDGKGGSRDGYRSSNEIEDMEIFDDDPGKNPSEDGVHDAKSIDDNRFRERK
jgi:hypothetical protein